MVMHRDNDCSVDITLTPHEALVLFDFLSRFDAEEKLTIKDRAEEQVLWNVLALLEKQMVEPFASDYEELLARARNALI